jgi:hypothetical protein
MFFGLGPIERYSSLHVVIDATVLQCNAGNRCLGLSSNQTPLYMTPVQPGGLMQLITPDYLPPAEAPFPLLSEADVVEPPLPNALLKAPTSSPGVNPTTVAPTSPNGQPKIISCFLLPYLAMLLAALFLI